MKNLIQKIINITGYKIVKNRSNHARKYLNKEVISEKNLLIDTLFSTLQKLNFEPKHIVDIGANKGTWTREVRKIFPHAVYTLIEPQQNMADSMTDLISDKEHVNYFAVGAGQKDEVLKFTFHERDDSCSFSYSEDDAEKRGFQQEELPVRSLNSLLREHHLPQPDIIKIDAEGLDLEVIEGASDYWGKTEIFLVEAGVGNKFYKNSILSVMKKMDEIGYELFDITDLNRPFPTKVLWLTELAFVKKNGIIANSDLKK